MANRIKGITVEINGDTAKLSKALESVNRTIKATQSQLKDVDKLLKPDPKNTELVEGLVDAIIENLPKLLDTAVKAVNAMGNDVMKAAETSLNADWNINAIGNVPTAHSVINNYYTNDNSRTVNQTNNSPEALSRLEIYRMARNALNV